MAALLLDQRPANVPQAQNNPTRLTAPEIMPRVAAVYGITPTAIVTRTNREAYQTTIWLLRRAANEPLSRVAVRFGVSASRISKIQAARESMPLPPPQRQAMQQCKVKQ
jgi:chromosomal replication initiation ATPase DnaA